MRYCTLFCCLANVLLCVCVYQSANTQIYRYIVAWLCLMFTGMFSKFMVLHVFAFCYYCDSFISELRHWPFFTIIINWYRHIGTPSLTVVYYYNSLISSYLQLRHWPFFTIIIVWYRHIGTPPLTVIYYYNSLISSYLQLRHWPFFTIIIVWFRHIGTPSLTVVYYYNSLISSYLQLRHWAFFYYYNSLISSYLQLRHWPLFTIIILWYRHICNSATDRCLLL